MRRRVEYRFFADQCLAIVSPMSSRERRMMLLFRCDGKAVLVCKNGIPLQILECLTSAKNMLSKGEILQTIGYVGHESENYLRAQVTVLRKHLGDDAAEPRFIETVREYGYRFKADLNCTQDSDGEREWNERGFGQLSDLLHRGAELETEGGGTTRPETRPYSCGVPAPGLVVGRNEEIATALTQWLAERHRPLLIWGPPGIGKSTLALSLLQHPETVRLFGQRRYWLRCDGYNSAAALKEAMGREWFGLTPSPMTHLSALGRNAPIDGEILHRLGEAPSACVIDNFETPHQGDPVESEKWLRILLGFENVWLIVTRHGLERPGGVHWSKPVEPTLLSPEIARELFCEITGKDAHRQDPRLDGLIDDLAGLPRAIELMAHQAGDAADLGTLLSRWEDKGTRLLERMGGESREHSLQRTYDFVIGNIDHEAGRLLRVMACLPEGIREAKVPEIFETTGEVRPLDAAATLVRSSLAFREGGRLRLLSPTRDYVHRKHRVTDEEIALARRYFLNIALAFSSADTVKQYVGAEKPSAAMVRLSEEFANVHWATSKTLDEGEDAGVLAAQALGRFSITHGCGNGELLQKAATLAGQIGDSFATAECSLWLGRLALVRGALSEAAANLALALDLFESLGSPENAAMCLTNLGEIAMSRRDFDEASAHFIHAMELFRPRGDLMFVSDCASLLGKIAFERSDYESAQTRYEEALEIRRQENYRLGEASSLEDLARIALLRRDYDVAAARFAEALEVYQSLGPRYKAGAAMCISELGALAFRCGDHAAAEAHLLDAAEMVDLTGPQSRMAASVGTCGDVLLVAEQYKDAALLYGEARMVSESFGDLVVNIVMLLRFGDAARRCNHDKEPSVRYGETLDALRQIGDPDDVGFCLLQLGHLARKRGDDTAAQMRYREATMISPGITDKDYEGTFIFDTDAFSPAQPNIDIDQ